jgi:hypothetical protein
MSKLDGYGIACCKLYASIQLVLALFGTHRWQHIELGLLAVVIVLVLRKLAKEFDNAK